MDGKELNLKTAEEVLEVTATVLLALGSLASGDEELQDSVSAAIAYVLGIRDLVREREDMNRAMMTVFVEAYNNRVLDQIEGWEPRGEA